MTFLALVDDAAQQQELQTHAGGNSIQFISSIAARPETTNFDALLVDLAAIHNLRDVLIHTSIPVLALTATPDEGIQAVADGADDYLLKSQLGTLLERRLHAYTQSKTRYILESVGDGVIIVNHEGIIRYCNPAAAALLGYPIEMLVGSNFGYPIVIGETTELDLFPPGVGRSLVVELRAVQIEWQGQPARLATLRDVTDRIQSAQELRLRDRAIRASTSAIFIIDVSIPEWRLSYANPAFEDITGYAAADVMHQQYDVFQQMHKEMPLTDDLLDVLASRQEYYVNTISQRKNGERYWSELRMSPIYDDLGRMSHIVVVQNDITQTKILEQERLQKEKVEVALRKERELNKIKDRFLTMMAHELHTPLASIGLSYDMLVNYGSRASEDERSEFLDNIRHQVDHLNHIVNDVLDISRTPPNGSIDLSPETIDLVPFCRRLVKETQKAHKSTHNIHFETNDRIVRAAVDAELMQRAVLNLLNNAVVYSPGGGDITLSLQSEGNTAVLEVHDNGIGIPEADHDRLFDAFHRGENVGNLPGTGLGLTITQQVIKAHDGQISVKSRVNEGTTFVVELPIAVAL